MTTIIISCLISLFVGLSGGFIIGQNTVVKTNIQNINNENKNYTTVNTDSKNFQAQMQITAIDKNGIFTNIGINLKDMKSAITNTFSQSNWSLSTTNGKMP